MAKYYLGERAARAVRQLMHGGSSVGTVPGADGEPVDIREYPEAFCVQWAQSLASGNGAWIIWLPSSDLVNVNGVDYDPTGSVTAAGGSYPTGWYQLTAAQLNRQTGGKLYLNIVKSTGGYELAFASSATTAEESFAVPICIASIDATTKERRIKQIAASVIVIGGSGGGGTSGYSGYRDVVKKLEWDSNYHVLRAVKERWHFENGLLKEIANQDPDVITTTPISDIIT